MRTVHRSVSGNGIGFLIVDDTLRKKDKFTKGIEGLDYSHSHNDGRVMWSHGVVASNYKVLEYSLPISFKLYL